ncbi:MAG: hypothetical protein Ct9H90mP6_11050 [Gammaproteobacteria bacterium]|nr:MAG: hypothetical protein Ct9H90mP6_11050 [Gammaproteobacteria bacterium]
MGFGHAVYSDEDPRNKIVKAGQRNLAQMHPTLSFMRFQKKLKR